MNVLPKINDLKKTTKIIKKYFKNDYKMYHIDEREIEKFRGLYGSEIMHIFNNRTWIDIWDDFDYIEISAKIDVEYFNVFSLLDYYYNNYYTAMLDKEERLKDFIFYFTGLFYLGAVAEIINDEGFFTIVDFLDPKDDTEEQLYSKSEVKKIFPSLIEKYSYDQLFLISILFLNLPKYVSKSKFGIKYWTWIYENTDDDIRKEIIKEFEESS